MVIREFQYVLAVAECGSLSKAADKLFITQPALTKYIHNLEENLNIKLFDRVGRNMQLTDYGRSYVDAARKVDEICRHLEQEVYASDNMLRGTLRIGSGRRGAYILPNIIPAFSKRFPAVSLELTEGTYDAVENKLLQGELDIGILKEPSHLMNDSLKFSLLFEEEIVLVTPADPPLNRYRQMDKDDFNYPWIDLSLFENENFILYKPEHRNRPFTDHLLMEAGILPSHILETDNVEGMLQLVKRGYGVCFAPEEYARSVQRSVRDSSLVTICSVGKIRRTYRYYAAYRSSSFRTRYSQAFFQLLEDHYKTYSPAD